MKEFDDRSELIRCFDALKTLGDRAPSVRRDPRFLKTLRLLRYASLNPSIVRDAVKQTKQLILRSPDFQNQQRNQNPFRLKTKPTILNGPIHLGQVIEPVIREKPVSYGITTAELNQNLLIAGRAGSGKTNLMMLIMLSLIRISVGWIAIDFKRDYRHLIRLEENVLVFDSDTFRINPLQPPKGTKPKTWLHHFTNIFCESFFAETPVAAKSALLELLPLLYEKIRVERGEDCYPTLFDLADTIDQVIKRKGLEISQPNRLVTIQSRLRPLLSISGSLFDCQKGYPLEELMKRNVVLEFQGLASEFQDFLVNLVFYSVFLFQFNQPRPGCLKTALIFDEAKAVMSRTKASGNSIISTLLSQSREMGLAAICADQMPSELRHALLANVFSIMTLSLSARRDQAEMATAIGLNSEQRDWMHRLKIGQGIVRMADRYSWPFLIQIPKVEIEKNVTDWEVEENNQRWLKNLSFESGTIESVAEINTESNPKPATAEETPISAAPDTEECNEPEIPCNLTQELYEFILHIKDHPFLNMTERYKELDLTSYKGNKLSSILLERGLCSEVRIKSSGKGRPKKYLALTKAAIEHFGPQNLGKGHGGFIHRYYQHRLQDVFKQQGYQPVPEAWLGGKAVDIGLFCDGKPAIAVEIGLSDTNQELINFRKDLEAGWPHVRSLCLERDFLEKLKKEWEKEVSSRSKDRVEFILLQDICHD